MGRVMQLQHVSGAFKVDTTKQGAASAPKSSDLDDASLLERFIYISLKQDEAKLCGDTRLFNRLFDQKIALVAVLRDRPGDHRTVLKSLYEHQNFRVRLNAAIATLAVAPLDARGVLEQLKNSKEPPYDADAWGVLTGLDTGRFVPT